METIVFLHGSAGSKRNFRVFRQQFPEYKTIVFDLIGFGDEEKPNCVYDVPLYVNFIKSKLDLKKKHIFVGHSMGAILAKEMALRYPGIIKKVICINYPMDKDKIRAHHFNRLFIEENITAKILCHTKSVWKFLTIPIGLIWYKNNFDSFWDYFKHSFHSEPSSLRNVILRDQLETLKKIKKKVVLITGEHDPFKMPEVVVNFKHYTIKGMGHLFFGYEQKIAEIIKNHL